MFGALYYILAVVDILVVAFIFYRGFLLIRGTRAVQALKGLGILIGISMIASFGKLQTLDWLLRKFWTWGAVAFIIIFAPDLKSVLARVGRVAAFLGGNLPDEREPIRKVVDAAERLSQIRSGALIVMAREATLDEVIETGIPVDAEISRELLMTIFHPETDLHDGAVIINNGRVVAANCFLPLSQDRRWENSLGTRHRAAVGLTEETDAVVVVVSEETGVLSVAMDGGITRYLEPKTLYEVLEDSLITIPEETDTTSEVGPDENR
jgi:diadenylate cyclase